jgi:CHASE3 domain sensor protein
MGQTRSRKITRRRKTRKGGGLLNTILMRAPKRLHTAMPYARAFTTTATLFAPEFNPLWAKRGSKVPEAYLVSARAPTKLKDIITSHGGEIPASTKIDDLRKAAKELLESQGLLVKSVSTPVDASALAPALVPEPTPSTNLVKSIEETTGQLVTTAIAESSNQVKEMVEETFGTTAETIKTYKQITPQKAKQLGLNGVPDNANTFSLRTLITQYTIRPIVEKIKITKANRELLKNGNVSNVNITNFEESALDALKVVLENTSRREVVEMATVFTPQRMRRFKMALFNVFMINPRMAKEILDIFFTDILARRRFSPGSIDSLITAMQIKPEDAMDKLVSESQKITNAERELINQKSLAEAKGMGWFRARTFYILLLGGLGAIPLFIMFWNGIYTPESFVFWMRQHYAQGSLNGSVTLPFSGILNEILNEGRVFFDALTLRMMEVHEQIAGSNVGRSVAEQTQTLKRVASAKYQEFTEPARPLTVYERLTRYISDQYSYFTGSNPPSEMR